MSRMSELFGDLCAIRAQDPDGWEHREPTEADHKAHQEWAIYTYGQQAWSIYSTTAWDSGWEI